MSYGAITFTTSAYWKTLQHHVLWVFSGMEIEQYVVLYTVLDVETSVLKGIPYWHRKVMKPSTAVSPFVKSKVSKCGVTSDLEFAVCVLKSHG
jgi:hypothetical protein